MNKRSYEDILYLPHPVSARHTPMPAEDRAAQFSPFAALTGYEAAVAETARLTDVKSEPDEAEKLLMSELLCSAAASKERISIVYFKPDSKKEGGAYRTASGSIRWVDTANRNLLLQGGRAIPLEALYSIQISEKEPLSAPAERDRRNPHEPTQNQTDPD